MVALYAFIKINFNYEFLFKANHYLTNSSQEIRHFFLIMELVNKDS